MNEFHLGVVFGLLSAATFVLLSFWSRELQHREGPWRYMLYISTGPVVIALVSWLVVPPQFSWPLVRAAALAATPAMSGLFFMGLAVRYGDMSHVAPIMGSKALVATVLAVTFGFEPVAPMLWVASGVLLVALFLLSGNREVIRRPWRVAEPALALALLMTVFASLSDLISRQQIDAHGLRVWDFLTVGWIIRGTFCALVLLVVCAVRRQRPRLGRPSTFLITAPVVALHGVVFVAALRFSHSAVLTNVLTSFRGVIAVVVVLLLARWNLGRKETLTRGMVAARVVGSLLICLAVWLGLQGTRDVRDESSAAAPGHGDLVREPDGRADHESASTDGTTQPAPTVHGPGLPAAEEQPARPATLDDLYRRAAAELACGRPIVVTVHVCLCDNRQGIVPVSATLGDGDNPRTNLYWGAMYGVRTFLDRSAEWTLLADREGTGDVLREAVFSHRTTAGDRWPGLDAAAPVELILVAQAWHGMPMERSLEAFASDLFTAEPHEVRLPGGRTVAAGGASHVVGFVGHNSLMSLPRDRWPFSSIETPLGPPPKGWFVLACKSDTFFTAELSRPHAVPLLATRQFMAPEAYTLAALLEAFSRRAAAPALRSAAASAYARYQKISTASASGVFIN